MEGDTAPAETRSQAVETQGLLNTLLETIAATEDGRAGALEHANEEIDGLREALRTRTVIGQAIGLLMAEKSLSSDEAFAELVEKSSHSNVKLRDLAARVVELAEAGVERRRHSSA